MFAFLFFIFFIFLITQYPHYIAIFGGVIALIIVINIIRLIRRRRLIRAHDAELERQRIAEREKAQAEAAEREKREKEAAERAEQVRLSRPFEAPEAVDGFALCYSYPDVHFDCPQPCFAVAKAVPPHTQLYLEPYGDGNTIGIKAGDTFMGYLPKNKLSEMFVNFTSSPDKTYLAMSCSWDYIPTMSLFFYLSVEELERRWANKDSFTTCTLVGNGGSEIQENITLREPGEKVTFEYDIEKSRWAVSVHMSEIGYCPTSMNSYFDDYGEVEGRILSIDLKDNGKYSVKVMMIEQ